ncbi:hypothetical protein F4778DRAFT_782592 [Xylariomycetidae sp. FL2044]|nr:hypothetical protein F4778DRAFT_782592 [Xylariomycetidae sp. FL2044]
MHFSTAITSLLAASMANAATTITEDMKDGLYDLSGRSSTQGELVSRKITEDMEDGLYDIDHRSDVKPRLIAPYTPYNESDVETRGLERRLPITKATCKGGILDSVNYDQALGSLSAWCDDGKKVGKKSGKVAKIGSVQVYVCSWGGKNPCSSGELKEMDKYLNDKCGNPNAGRLSMSSWKKGYGRVFIGEPTCNW